MTELPWFRAWLLGVEVGSRRVGAADVVQKKKKSYFRKHFWRNGSIQAGRGEGLGEQPERTTEAGWGEIC